MIFFCVAITGETLIGLTAQLFGLKGKGKIEINKLSLILAILIAPVLEELLFRGPIFVFFDNSILSWLLAILWGGLFFGILHVCISKKDYKKHYEIPPNRRYIITTVVMTGFKGIILSLLVINTKSLIAAMILHGLFNAHGLYAELVIKKTSKT